jgi:hypothetical protein
MIVPVTWFFNSTCVVCLSPPTFGGRIVTVRVSNGYFADSAVNPMNPSSAFYTYDKPVLVSRIIPPLGPISGNISVCMYVCNPFTPYVCMYVCTYVTHHNQTPSLQVTVIGGPFTDTDELRCKFGRIAVAAEYLSEGRMRCFAPPHPGGVYPLEVCMYVCMCVCICVCMYVCVCVCVYVMYVCVCYICMYVTHYYHYYTSYAYIKPTLYVENTN